MGDTGGDVEICTWVDGPLKAGDTVIVPAKHGFQAYTAECKDGVLQYTDKHKPIEGLTPVNPNTSTNRTASPTKTPTGLGYGGLGYGECSEVCKSPGDNNMSC